MNQNGKRVAVILNENARRVTNGVMRRLCSILPEGHIYPTKDIDEAKEAISEIIDRRFDIIFTGGGDGTIVTTITNIWELQKTAKDIKLPSIGILKMGTGNAWAWGVGVKDGFDPLRDVAKGGDFSVSKYNLIKVFDTLCPIAGMGWDAQVLNDYYDVNVKFSRTPIKGIMGGLFGYLCAALFKSIPTVAKIGSVPEVEVRFIGDRIEKPSRTEGSSEINLNKGDVIYSGLASIVAAGTIPYFGYAFRAFPFAEDRAGLMDLRISNLDVSRVVKNIHRLWAGTYETSRIIDFLTDGVSLVFDRDMPIEIGGDPMGFIKKGEEVEFRISDFTVDVIDLR
jgi:diacylglycerol kinase family enzyme